MGSNRTQFSRDQARETVAVQLPLPMVGTLVDVRSGFFSLCIEAGRQVLNAMMEHDRTATCGPKWVPNPNREAKRAGSTPSEITLGGRRIPIKRPRARSVSEEELKLPSFLFAAARDPLDARTMEAIGIGVSTRHYHRSLDPLPLQEAERAVSKSAVSRRFVALSAELLGRWLRRRLGDLDLRVVMIDGIRFDEHCILIALGITADGTKRVLGLREGSTENATVAIALLSDLVERGLPTDRAVLFVIDGAKALRKAIRETFGHLGLVGRCQLHKKRNVRDHLPEHLHASVARVMNAAYDRTSAVLAKRELERLARSLERSHPGAATSLREGLEETLTLQCLGVRGRLYETLRTTNPIENLNDSVTTFSRNVKRWRGGAMVIRWIGTGLHAAEGKFRRVRGFRDLPRLVAALKKHEAKVLVDMRRQVA